MNRDTHIIEAENLTKLFYPTLSYSDIFRLNFKLKSPLKALDNISFRLKRGKILGILGPNGTGKTTLLKIIATLIIPDSGNITIKGGCLEKDDDKIKSIVGYAGSEERSFYWRLTGMQNLKFFAALYGLNKKQAKLRIRELLGIFKVDYQNRRFDSYSTGMKRKFALMRALLHNPEILLLDEPTKSLDYGSSLELRNLIRSINYNGKTVILATHNMDEAQNLCDLLMILQESKAYGLGTLEELSERAGLRSVNLTDIYLKLTQND